MKTEETYYIAKMFSISHDKYFYLYGDNPYHSSSLIANRYESYEDCLSKIQEFFQWNSKRRDFDANKCKVCKISFIEEDCE